MPEVLVKSCLRERITEKPQFTPFDSSPCQYQQPTKYSNILGQEEMCYQPVSVSYIQHTGPSTQQAPLYFVRMTSLALDIWPSSAAAATSATQSSCCSPATNGVFHTRQRWDKWRDVAVYQEKISHLFSFPLSKQVSWERI